MIGQLYVEKKNLKVEWVGLTKADKNGKQKNSVQFSTRSPEGQAITFYAAQDKAFVPVIKEGDVLNTEMKVRAYKDGLYCDLVKHEIVNNGNGSKVKV
jgi:hypothetical protein